MKNVIWVSLILLLQSCNNTEFDLSALRGAVITTQELPGDDTENNEIISCLGDFNKDGFINTSDLSLLMAAIGSDQEQFDLNNDGEINQHDVDWLKNHFGVCTGAIYPSACAADMNGDGHINAADLSILLSQVGLVGTGYIADLNNDAIVDDKDQQILLSYMGQSVSCESYDNVFTSCLGDFNLDGIINASDNSIFLKHWLTDNNVYDLNADGIVDQHDLDWLNNHHGICEGAIYPGPCAADVNGDGIVNISDLIWINSQNGAVGESLADLDQNGIVNAADLQIVQSYLGLIVTSCE